MKFVQQLIDVRDQMPMNYYKNNRFIWCQLMFWAFRNFIGSFVSQKFSDWTDARSRGQSEPISIEQDNSKSVTQWGSTKQTEGQLLPHFDWFIRYF